MAALQHCSVSKPFTVDIIAMLRNLKQAQLYCPKAYILLALLLKVVHNANPCYGIIQDQ